MVAKNNHWRLPPAERAEQLQARQECRGCRQNLINGGNMLYEFTKFRVKKNKWASHPDLDGIQFCLRALTKNKSERRMHVIRLYVKEGVMVGTDGNRLHTYKLETDMPDGFYRPLINTKANVIIYHEKDNTNSYPEYQDLIKIPDGKPDKMNMCFGEHHMFACYALAIRELSDEATLRFDYFKDLGDDYFDFYAIRDGQCALLANAKKTALIMSMRM
jgi:hypothetical protein